MVVSHRSPTLQCETRTAGSCGTGFVAAAGVRERRCRSMRRAGTACAPARLLVAKTEGKGARVVCAMKISVLAVWGL